MTPSDPLRHGKRLLYNRRSHPASHSEKTLDGRIGIKKFALVLVGIVLAMTLASLSSFIERVGPDMTVSGNLCGPGGNENCYEPALKGGFPLAYLVDEPGISVPGRLSIIEDHFNSAAFGGDVCICFIALLVAYRLGRRPDRESRAANPGS